MKNKISHKIPGITKDKFIQKRMPKNTNILFTGLEFTSKKDQPIQTPSENFSEINYNEIAYYKTSKWMKKLELSVGKSLFDSCLHEYYNRWKFKHPYPEDFKKVVEDVSNKNVDQYSCYYRKREAGKF